MNTEGSSEKSFSIYQNTSCDVSEDSHLPTCGNLKYKQRIWSVIEIDYTELRSFTAEVPGWLILE
jgi:hypothetical protein